MEAGKDRQRPLHSIVGRCGGCLRLHIGDYPQFHFQDGDNSGRGMRVHKEAERNHEQQALELRQEFDDFPELDRTHVQVRNY